MSKDAGGDGAPRRERGGSVSSVLSQLRRAIFAGPEMEGEWPIGAWSEPVQPGMRRATAPRLRSKANLRWLIHLRWAAIAGQLVTVTVVHFGMEIGLPLLTLYGIIAVELVTNAILLAALPRISRDERGGLQLAVTVLDTILLTGLLALTGGIWNPFCSFLVVYVTLAAVLLPMRFAALAAAAVIGSLWFLKTMTEPVAAIEESLSLRGWGEVVALGLNSLISLFFVSRVTRALVRQSEELEAERERRERRRHLEALGTLAAGAAHELGTPLSTIAIVAKELELRLARSDASEDEQGDARLIRDEVARCRRILGRMSTDAGGGTGEALVPTQAGELAREIVTELAASDQVRVAVDCDLAAVPMELPRGGLVTSVRAIIQNAVDASPAGTEVVLQVARSSSSLSIEVSDEGSGMAAADLERASEPFFTTKEVGRGMGLGLYLATSFIESLGGVLDMQSELGGGTRVMITIPLGPTADGSVAPALLHGS